MNDTTIAAQSPRNNKPTLSILLQKHGELIAAAVSGVIILCGLVVENISSAAPWYLFLLAYLIGGYAKAKEGIEETLNSHHLNVELLMIIAAIGAAAIGHWFEGSVLIFIFALSGALETYSLAKSSNALTSLMSLQPDTARRVLQDGTEEMIAVEKLAVEDIIRIKPGERIPADAIIIKGETTVDEAAMTGESMPVFKSGNSEILAGTVNIDGTIQAKVAKNSSDTTFGKILRLVEKAQNEKVPSQLFIERFEGIYVNVVLLLVAAMIIFPPFLFGWSWSATLYKAMVLLVVASPCALVASTMPAVLSAIAFGARQGILVKGGTYFSQLSELDAIAFDKTGTLTVGSPEVIHVINQSSLSDDEFISIAAAVENETTHPIAKAIIGYAEQKQADWDDVSLTDIKTKPGYGVSAVMGEQTYKIGKPGWVSEKEADEFKNRFSNEFDLNKQAAQIFVERDGIIIGCFSLIDKLRPEASSAIAQLNRYGIKSIMLTGDQQSAATMIGEETGVTDVIAGCLPEHKAEEVEKLKDRYKKVGMIGDGINDTPALATAHIGIAMGEGTDAALETADVVLVKNDLQKLAEAIKVSKKMNRIIKQNIGFALGMIVILIASNFITGLSLPLGVVGHEGSTILVILNGLRLLKG